MRAAVLDLGSTSFNLLIADVSASGEIRPVAPEKVMLRLGAVTAASDRIPGNVTRRVLEVARELPRAAKHEEVQHFLPVATSALRGARNGAKVSEKLSKVLNTRVRVLRAHSKITSHFRIPSSGHLRPILNREILAVASYACGFAQSDRPNLTQIWARKWEVILE